MFLIKKRDEKIKARAYADGSKQRRDESYNKHEYASPTCANNSIMVTSAIEAKEGRDVAIGEMRRSSCYSKESWLN